MSYTILGSCSRCGGAVVIPSVWFGVFPPTPTCNSCGATKRHSGPVIDMDPPSKTVREFIVTNKARPGGVDSVASPELYIDGNGAIRTGILPDADGVSLDGGMSHE